MEYELVESFSDRGAAGKPRQQDVADRLGVGLATVKRWLSGETLSLRHLEELCEIANVEFYDLIAVTGNCTMRRQTKFTPSQERALGANQVLFFLFFALLNDRTISDCMHDLSMSQEEMNEALEKLQRLGLLDILLPDRVRMLTTRDVTWREDGPISGYFKARGSFVTAESSADIISTAAFVPLGAESLAKIRTLMEESRREIQRMANSGRASRENRTWYGILFFARPLNMHGLKSRMTKGAAAQANSSPEGRPI